MDIRIEKPILNRRTNEENIAVVDKWISDTADKLNIFIHNVEEERRKANAKD